MDNTNRTGRIKSLGRHLRRNLVAYIALTVALTMTPLPSQAALLIGTKNIKNGAVTAKKIAPGAVKNVKIRDGAVTGAKIAAGSVTASKLGTIVVVTADSADVADGNTAGATATCPAGSVVIGGGYDSGGNATPWRVQRSYKTGNGWRAFGTNQTGGNSFMRAQALCLQ